MLSFYRYLLQAYGIKIWQLITFQWRYWRADTLPLFYPEHYNSISIQYPPAIIFDRISKLVEWNELILTQKLPKISSAYNKYMIPCILCPWGCSEFNFHSGFVA